MKHQVVLKDDREKVISDCQAITRLYGGLAVVYEVDGLYGWAYTAGARGSVVVAGFVDGVEWAIIGRGDGSAQFLGPVIDMYECVSDEPGGDPVFSTSAGLLGFDKINHSSYCDKWYLIRL